MSLAPFYAHWATYDRLLTEHVRGLGPDDLALAAPVLDTSGTAHWPLWAIVAHLAGARVYWLCIVLGEPGVDRATFVDAETLEGWEDDLSRPRSAEELVEALETSWDIVSATLDRWTPEMLGEAVARETPRGVEHHTRESLLMRMITHDAYHAGEIALIEGMHGRPQLDLWPAGVHTVEAATS